MLSLLGFHELVNLSGSLIDRFSCFYFFFFFLHSIEQSVQTPNANTLSENVELMSNLDEIEIN